MMTRHRLRTKCREAHIVIWLKERGTTNADRFCLLNGQLQIDFVGRTQHDKMATLFGLKAPSSFQTGVTDLHDLIGRG
jgi:hypothetical protein